ncbi:hypothetical protein HID58_051286, partial [Brassica napus]
DNGGNNRTWLYGCDYRETRMQESTEITPRREANRGLWVTSILCQFFNLFAALKDEDREGLVNALKVSFVLYNKLQILAGQHSDVLENLTPKIRRRVEVLREIQAYHMIDEDEPLLEKAIGREIDWYPGKCLTQKILKKKPKKGAKNAKPITKTEDCESFFNPPQVPDDDEDIDEDRAEELQNLMEHDYDIGRQSYTRYITGFLPHKGGRPQLHDGQQGERPPECKQQ